MNNPHKGSTFDSFLEKEGLLDDAEAAAIKRAINYELKKVDEDEGHEQG